MRHDDIANFDRDGVLGQKTKALPTILILFGTALLFFRSYGIRTVRGSSWPENLCFRAPQCLPQSNARS